jgi:hypothetical protein
MTRLGTILTGFLALAATSHAASFSNEVLAIGVGARAMGMGGAYVAVADDSTASYWNPAGLPGIKHIEVSAVQQGREDKALALGTNEVGSEYFFMSGGMTVPQIGTFAGSIMRFGVAGIDQIPYDPAVAGCPTCPPPSASGQFSTQDLAFIGSYGRQLHPAFAMGINLKALVGGTQGLKPDPASGITGDAGYSSYGVDLGLKSDLGGLSPSLKGLRLAVNIQDLYNTGATWSTGYKDTVAMNAKTGLAYSLPFEFLRASNSELTLAADMDPKYSTLFHYGVEFWYKEVLAFRAGMRQFTNGLQSSETSFGASFRLFMLQADYAFINYELTPIHYLSLSVKL